MPLPICSARVWFSLTLLTGCVAPGAPDHSAIIGWQTHANETDQRKFLIATSMLGRSLEEDTKLLRQMTGHRFEPKPQKTPFPLGETRYFEYLRATDLSRAPMLMSATFAHRTYDSGRYQSSSGFVFN